MSAQDYVHQVFVLNEGYFDYALNQSIEPVTIGSYNPSSQTYSTVDTIHGARFASDLALDDNCFYVAADNILHKYDKNNYNLIASQQIDGIRKIAIWQDKIIVTRGDYDNITFSPISFNSYLQIYNTSDLSLYMDIDTTIGPRWSTQNIIIDNDKAYIAINNAFDWGNEKGIIGIFDLNSFSYLNEIDLGIDGKNPDNMFQEGTNIYTVNNKDWSGSSISRFSLLTSSVSTINLASVSTGCGSSCLRSGKINYQLSGDSLLYEWDIVLLPSTGTSLNLNKMFYNMSYDEVNDLLYASSTDFSTYGNINIYNNNNYLVYSFQCGVSPGRIVFDTRNITTEVFDILCKDNEYTNKFYDMLGRRINYSPSLLNGIYISNSRTFYIKQ
ncbi:MAG: hypothetical protein VYD71_01260 [Bacteroidota bacterium]|nr:hypothetical protein [Bacteroidota bacterium]